MKDNLDFVAIRPSSLESSFLTKIAIENMLVKKNGEPSLGLAVKHILKEKMIENKQKSNDGLKGDIEHITNLLEQINVTMPHLVYGSRFSSMYALTMLKNTNLTQSQVTDFKASTLKDTNQICGQIQAQDYQTLYVSQDIKNMKTIPIDEDKNQWK
ncbi:hypothetical protein N8865_01085 [Francisellaceae bacterium]|nr:hypothetical protein [Francisellaceae bacterium]